MGMFNAFVHPAFRLLWTASLLGQIGYWFITIAFQWVLPHSTDADAVLLGLLYFCTFLPYLLFALPSGALADKYDRRRLLMIAQAAAAALGVTCLVLSVTDSLTPPVVLSAGFAGGCVVVLVSPASQAFTANTVPADHLTGAISLQSISLNIARIAGPSVTGLLLLSGATGVFVAYAVVSLLAFVLLGRIRIPSTAFRGESEGIVARVRAGVTHAHERRPSIATLAIIALASLLGSAYQSQLPILGTRIAEDGDTAFIVLVITSGVGSLVGVILLTRMNRRPQLSTVVKGLLLLGIAESLMGAHHSYPLMLALIAVAGAATFWTMTCGNIVLQHAVDDAQRGRVMSLYFLCWGGLLPFGGIGIGSLIGAAGSPLAFAVFGLAALLGGLFVIVHNGRQKHIPTALNRPVRDL